MSTHLYRPSRRFRVLDALYVALIEESVLIAEATGQRIRYRRRTDRLLHWIAERVLSEYEFDMWAEG